MAWVAEPLHVVDCVCAACCDVDDVVLDQACICCPALVAAFWWVLTSVLVAGGGGAWCVAPAQCLWPGLCSDAAWPGRARVARWCRLEHRPFTMPGPTCLLSSRTHLSNQLEIAGSSPLYLDGTFTMRPVIHELLGVGFVFRGYFSSSDHMASPPISWRWGALGLLRDMQRQRF